MKTSFFAAALLAAGLPLALQADTVVVFNEIMYHPATNEPAMEWIELRNQMAVDVDISGWSLQGAIQFTFPSNSIVAGAGLVLVAISPNALAALTGLTNICGPFTGRLGNNGDHLELRNNSGWLMDQVDYGVDGDWPVAPDGSGVSLAKVDPDSASAPAGNWAASAQVGGTPGAENFPSVARFIAPPGLVSYWTFDESGPQSLDQAGENSGTLGSGVLRANGGLSFNGTSNAYVNFGPGTALSSFGVSNGLTIELMLTPVWDGSNTVVLFAKAPTRPGAYRATVLASRPLAYWRLDDTNTTIRDATANAHNGTATAGVARSQPSLISSDPTNFAVRATGSQRITINGFEKIGAAGYAVEFWVKVNVLPTGCCQNLVGDGESSGDYFLMNYILGPGQGLVGAIRPHFGPNNSPVSMDSSSALQVGGTYHIVTTWNATNPANNAVIYINGVADRVGTTTMNVPAAGTYGNNMVFIGYDNREVADGDYTYDEVALYNRPLGPAEVSSHYAAATITNFDLSHGNAVQLAFKNDGSNALANPPVADGPVLSFGLTVDGLYSELDLLLDGQEGRPTLAALQDGQPHHLAATYDSAAGMKAIYLDGVLGCSVSLAGFVNAQNSANAVAGNSAVQGNVPYTGALDDLAFWGRALSPSEIAAHVGAVQAGYDYFTPTSQVETTSIAFNEVAAATNSNFWVELINYGTSDAILDGFRLYRDGTTNQAYLFPSNNLSLPAGGLLALDSATLGFRPDAGDKLYLFNPAGDRVLDGVVVKRTARARHPDAIGPWLRPDLPTPGASNHFAFHGEIVINEIMYHHALLPGSSNAVPQPSPEAWIELYNRSPQPVDLTGWELAGGISYYFSPGKTVGPGGYLVVAKDAAYLRSLYPLVDIVGDFGGNLSGESDLIRLLDPTGNPANEVRYFVGGHWPEVAGGGGSSLELRDPNADNSKAEAWAASDESHKTSWQTYSYRMVANVPNGSGQPNQWNDFIFGLQGDGECLIDDLAVVESPTNNPIALIANGDFENGLGGWRLVGDHMHSRLEEDPDNPGNHVLHVVAVGPQEHMHNHVERTLVNNRAVVNGREYQISFRARWLAGNNLLNTRLYFNRCARTVALPMPLLNGTPGARNSRFEANIGPTFSQFRHAPVAPQPDQSVTVSVIAQDPQGVGGCLVWWSTNGGAWSSAPMTDQGGGAFAGAIPGYPAGTIVQFYVSAVDGLGAASTYPAAGPDSGALYTVSDGQANLPLGHNVRIILTPANRSLLHAFTNVMSNENLPCTVIYDEHRAYYDMVVRLKGSERGRYSDTRVSFHLTFPPDDLFRGVHPVMLIDRSGAGDSTANKQEEIVIRHILLHAGNIPGTYPDLCRVIAPFSTHTGPAIFSPRHEDRFVETVYANGGQGIEWELELIYYPTSTNQFGFKNPQPDNVIGTDISNLGDDKEIYRYNFIIKNHRAADDYGRFMRFAKTFSLTGNQLDVATRQVMDVDEWMRVWAHVTLCGVGDSYTFGNNHNLLMYSRPVDLKMLAFPVDMDFAFVQGTSASLIGDQNLSTIIRLTPNLRVFYAHILDIIGSTFNSSYITYWANRYDDFCPGQSYAGVPAYVQARGDFAKSQIAAAGGNAAFAVNGSASITAGSNLLTFTGTAPVTARTIRVNGRDYPIAWTGVSTWSMRVPVSEATNQLQFLGYDVRGAPLSNLTAVVNVTYTNAIPDARGVVVINEIMYHPAYPEAAYVELFNTSSNFAFDLSGWRLNGLAFTFPAGSYIGPRQYAVLAKDVLSYLAAYGSNAPVPLASYPGALQNDGETLTLFRPGDMPGLEVVVDRVRYGSAPPWPAAANGVGSSLQLVDPAQDHSRPCNWFSDYQASYTNYDWRFLSVSGAMGVQNRLLIYLGEPGSVYLDDLCLVTGTSPGVGSNYIRNGDFEAPLLDDPVLTNSFFVPTNYTNTTISAEIRHSGNSSLHLVADSAGTALGKIITQNLSPAPSNTTTCTLSFWYLPSTNGSNLYVRVQSSTLSLSAVVRPNYVPTLFYATPGSNNVTTVTNLPPIPPLWLNEVQPENVFGLQDAAGHRVPWIELYNAGTNVELLEGICLANNYTNLAQWAFASGSVLNPGEFRVVFADGATNESSLTEWHAGFTLPPANGSVVLVRLVNGAPQVLDYLDYHDVRPDRSYGSYPDGQLFDRQEFYHVTPGAPNDNTAAPLQAFINEWMAANNHTLLNTNNSNRYDDWFELYNPTAQPASLDGCFLTDNLTNRFQDAIPPGFVIPPHGFLLVWADNNRSLSDTNIPELHVNFRLNQAGEQIGLFAGDGRLVDGVTFGLQTNDVSQGRYPDGSASLVFMTQPTPGAPNIALLPNLPPLLNPVGNKFVTLGQALGFTVTASDADFPAQQLRFSLDAGAPAGAGINPTNGQFRWTPTADQAPSVNPVTIRVTDGGNPPLSASESILITVWLPPRLSTTGLEGNQVELVFGTVPGTTYRIEFTTRLENPSWAQVGSNVTGDGTEKVFIYATQGLPQGFYRVVQMR